MKVSIPKAYNKAESFTSNELEETNHLPVSMFSADSLSSTDCNSIKKGDAAIDETYSKSSTLKDEEANANEVGNQNGRASYTSVNSEVDLIFEDETYSKSSTLKDEEANANEVGKQNGRASSTCVTSEDEFIFEDSELDQKFAPSSPPSVNSDYNLDEELNSKRFYLRNRGGGARQRSSIEITKVVELPAYAITMFYGLGAALISTIEKSPIHMCYNAYSLILLLTISVLILMALKDSFHWSSCGNLRGCRGTTNGRGGRWWGVGTSILLFVGSVAPWYPALKYFTYYFSDTKYGLLWMSAGTIPVDILLLVWAIKRYWLNGSSNQHSTINTTCFWRGYWASLGILASCLWVGWGSIAYSLALFPSKVDEYYTETCDFDCWYLSIAKFYIAYCASIFLIMIIFLSRIMKWRKSIDIANSANRNISRSNGIYCTDLFVYIIGFPFGSLMIGQIQSFQLYVSLTTFFASTSVVVMVWKAIITYRNSATGVGPKTTIRNKKYPTDTYSFLALYSPTEDPNLFCFGLMIFLLQVIMLILLLLSVVFPRWRTTGEVDNTEEDWISGFLPANVHPIVRATQITSIFAYVLIRDANVADVATAIEYFHWDKQPRTRGLCLSCVLRLTQGVLAFFAVFLLVMTSSEVVEIILNFTAVNFISNMDECAYSAALAGNYGASVEEGAKRIESEDLPRYVYQRSVYKRSKYTFIFIFVVMAVLTLSIVRLQEASNQWVAPIVRVQFEESSSFSTYSGCFNIDEDKRPDKRYIYRSNEENDDQARLGYCSVQRRWLFFRGSQIDSPCDAYGSEMELAHSIKTDSFEIQSIYGENWYSAFNAPLEMFFIEDVDVGENCDSFLGDGKCDVGVNNFFYQYDGGDCCAYTCSLPECGKESLSTGFGVEILSGDGYPYCNDPSFVSITIRLDEVMLNQNDYLAKPDQFENPSLKLSCDGYNVFTIEAMEMMENATEAVLVQDGSTCSFYIEDYADSGASVTYSVYHGYNNEFIIGDDQFSIHQGQTHNEVEKETFTVHGIFNRDSMKRNIGDYTNLTSIEMGGYNLNGTIPREIGLVTKLTALNLSSGQLTGTIPVEIGSLTELRQLDLSENEFEGFIPDDIWRLTGLKELDLSWNDFDDGGTIPKHIGLMTDLEELDLDTTHLYGNLPSEIWSLTELRKLNIGHNYFDTSTIPSDIGLMTGLTNLFLGSPSVIESNHRNFHGAIPSEMWSLTELRALNLSDNYLVGVLPSNIGLLTELTYLSLGGNLLNSGTIPTEIGLLTNLRALYLGLMGLHGTVPSEIGMLTELTALSFDSNLGLVGALPSELGLLTKLTHFKEGGFFDSFF